MNTIAGVLIFSVDTEIDAAIDDDRNDLVSLNHRASSDAIDGLFPIP